jgi:hypothetical protein
VGANSIEQATQDGYECKGDERNCDGGEQEPEEEGVPLPQPEPAGEVERVFAGGVKELVRRERHGRGAEDAAGDVDERNDQDDLERIDDVIAQLRGGDVEAEDEGQGEAEDGGAAKDGIDADEQSGGDAPGESLGSSAHAEQCEDGKGDAAVDPAVVEGSEARARFVAA